MPPKKKNNKKKQCNGFYMYMMDKKRGFEIECGKDLTMPEMVSLAHPGWKYLSDEERLKYNVRAKSYSQQEKRHNLQAGAGKMDCTGQLINERVDFLALNDRRRSDERRKLIEKWPVENAVCMEKFHLISFETLCELPDEQGYLPCEISCVSYSLYAGIIDVYHQYVDPGRLPIGYRYLCQSKSDETNKIPVSNFELATANYRQIWIELCDFLNPQQHSVFPPVFCQFQRRNEVEGCLRWLSDHAGVPNRLSKVYEVEVLLCELFVHMSATPPSHSAATDLLTTTAFDYDAGTRCKYHEDNEVPMDYCALGKTKKNCFCISDALASLYNIELTSSHLPERQDDSSCLVIPPSVYNSQYSSIKPQTQHPKNAIVGGRGMDVDVRRKEVNGMDHQPTRKVVQNPEVKEEPLRRPTSVSVTSILAAKQIQPMKDREMGTEMAPSTDLPSKFALPASAPSPSVLPLPGASWQGPPKVSHGEELADQLNAKCNMNPMVGIGLGRGLGRGFIRNTNQ
ncbi:protein maelstrom homolog [Asterias rubens]|uniref:protein maelstrom homolog n=1 Tax=Asterias rubens TaxID=7604 RepID=UPI001454EA1E|nr:protein maelstrom homolog [Asterias rubens]